MHKKVLMLASVASMIDQFNMPNIRLLLELGFDVHVACNFREGNTCDANRLCRLQKELRGMHVAVHQWDCPRDVFPVWKCCIAYRQLWELTGRFRYEWIHCHSPVGGALARMVAHRRGIRTMYTAHGFHFYQGAPVKNWLLYYPAEKLLAYWTDVLITVNREDDRFAKANLQAGSIWRIPGAGICTAKFARGSQNLCGPFRAQYRIPQDAFLLLSVGELNEGKNHRAVLDALALLQDESIYYLICGKGTLREKLLQHAARLGIAGRVRMPGYVEDVAAACQASDFFVLPSRREGLSAALVEAMAAGLPCIVSDIRGNRELVIEQELRFHPGHPEELAKILAKLKADKKLCQMYGSRNRQRSLRYDIAAAEEKMRKIYEELLDE